MRLAVLTEFFYPDSGSGTGKVMSQLARKLHDQHGFEVDVYCSINPYRTDSPSAPPESDWNGVRIRRFPSPDNNRKGTAQRFLGNWVLTRAIGRAIQQEKYDAVIVTTAPPVLPQAALQYRRRKGVPYAYIVYDLEPDRTSALGIASPKGLPVRGLKSLQRRWLRQAGRVVPIGRCMTEILVERYGVDRSHVELLEVGYPGPSRRISGGGEGFRARHGLKGFLAVYSGNFARYHEFDTVLDAASKLNADEATFLLIGGGHKKSYLEQEIKRRGLKNVRMMSFVPDEEYEELLQASDLSIVSLVPGVEGTCVPSKFYSLLANGRPTVAIMASPAEVARTIAESGCGVVVSPGDSDGLVAQIRRLSSDPEHLQGLGTAAADVFDQKYDEDRLVDRWAKMLREMASGTR
jgi:glycosyltransferase involved in cell wall biosynthesis